VDDQVVWNLFREGNRKALSDIFLTHQPDLFRYAKRWIPDDEQIKDLIQELFLNLWNKHKQLGSTNNIKAYLIRALRNRIINFNQANKLETTSNFIENELFHYQETDFEYDEKTNPEQKQKLIECLNHLPYTQREAVYLKYFEALSIDEIAEIMNLQNQSVRNNLHRALTKLRERMLISLFI
jgi:RNA polymerase sigma factor (sigma-70 family)